MHQPVLRQTVETLASLASRMRGVNRSCDLNCVADLSSAQGFQLQLDGAHMQTSDSLDEAGITSALERIRVYARKHALSEEQIEVIFESGIASCGVFQRAHLELPNLWGYEASRDR